MTEEVKAPVTVEQLDNWVKELNAQYAKCEEMKAALSKENLNANRLEQNIAQALKELGRDNYQTPDGTFYSSCAAGGSTFRQRGP